jgi:hypothetical protein
MTEYFFTFTGTGSDTLEFNFQNGPGWLGLDNVTVESVPEPAAWLMMLGGLFSIGAGLRMARKKDANGFAAA